MPGRMVVNSCREESLLEQTEILEIFARHKEDPELWTPRRLAEFYDTGAS